MRYASRRGVTYLLFLGVATIVMLIGLIAVTFTRAEVGRAVASTRTAKARTNAMAGIDQALLKIYTDDNWRTKHVNDAWSAKQSLGTGSFQWKLVDESSGSLTADQSAPVRVYGRGTEGDAVWIYSVLVQPPPTAASLAASKSNLITNGGFSSDTTAGWMASGGAQIQTSNSGSAPADGQPHLETGNRKGASAGPQQKITTALVSGNTYDFSCELRLKSGRDTVYVGILIDATGGAVWVPIASPTVQSNWVSVTANVTPTWEGNLNGATLVFMTSSSLEDFDIDGVSLVHCSQITIGPIAGTWRRESE